ncbi:MAG TPA: tripartite tricarboxylate transporter substrate binding protein [Burkholderiales bacterium]|nr:tripartite tricarboxylate transporter substrate binding protein [Burkholderiales bacterium]
MLPRHVLCSVLYGIALLLAVPESFAQPYPARPIRLVVPYPPGGGADNVARPLAQKLSEALGQQVVIDNRGGAAGIVGAQIVAQSKPDGYTLLDDSSSRAVNPAIRPLPFDTMKDFAPISMIVINPSILVVHPSLPVNTVADLIRLAKQRPRQIMYASSGVGSALHMGAELFKYLAKVDMLHVPYKGGGPALADLIGGHVQLVFPNIASGLPHVKSGKLKGIAVCSTKRSRAAPQLPTVAESGLPGFELYEWNALFAPAGTPPEIIARLNAELAKVLRMPDIQERLFQMGAEPAPGTPQELDDYVRREIVKWEKVVRVMNIKVE